MGSAERGSHEGGGGLRAFLTDGEHMSMGTSTYVKKIKKIKNKISSFFFPPFFPSCFFLNFTDLSLSSLVF